MSTRSPTTMTKTEPEFIICFRCQRATNKDDIERVDALGGEPLCSDCEREVFGR